MKYFTPEWYNDTIVADMCFQLRKTPRAATFSESFFERLYAVEKKAFLKHSKRWARMDRQKFDADAAAAEFDSNYQENLEFVKANLPTEILSAVADVRVLALGSAEYDVATEITRYCGQVNRKCEKADECYREELERVAERLGWVSVNSLEYLVGKTVASVHGTDTGLTVTVAPELGENSYRVTLVGAKCDGDGQSAVGKTVVQHELTLDVNGGLCFGLLLIDENAKTSTLFATAEGFEIEEIA